MVGLDDEGNKSLLMGVPMNLYMSGVQRYIGLVASIPLAYISETLDLDSWEGKPLYAFIIRKDGSFVIRSFDAYRDSFFDRIKETYEVLDEKEPEQYVTELQAAMAADENYSAMVRMYGTIRHMYCINLPNCEWYLVTVMPYGTLNEAVDELNGQWQYVSLGASILIFLMLTFVSVMYFKNSQRQLKELVVAKNAAEHANRAKSEFLSNMSHDIRTPMNAIVGMTAIAINHIDDNIQQVRNCLKKIDLSSKHLLGLINDVLDMSKIESGKMTLNIGRVSLRDVIESIVNITQPQIKSKQQRFNVFIHNITVENVYCDSLRLNQVLLNILSNAIKFTPNGGSISITMREEPSPKGDRYIRILLSVQDNGIGISDEFQEHIFEAFNREDSRRVYQIEGSGLGMAITKYIIDAMDGSISLESKRGVGSTFSIVLDFEKATEDEEEMMLPNLEVLVVDDDRQLCESTVESLASMGIHADWSMDGETAVDMVKKKHAEQKDYQVIMLDWKLPGMDGIRTARNIKSILNDDVPILLISAYDWVDIEEEARSAGVDGFLAKPLFRSTLYYGLKQYICNINEHKGYGQEEKHFPGKRVLIAEDNELNWEVAAELLKDLELELEWAENGRICVDQFKQSEIGYYDAILMDFRMPVMSSYEATRAIRSMDRSDSNLPIIAMTADAFAEDAQKSIACGMNAHIAKPIDVKEVAANLDKFWNGRNA